MGVCHVAALGLGDWQLHAHAQTPSVAIVQSQAAAVAPRNIGRDRQPQARAAAQRARGVTAPKRFQRPRA